MAEEERRAAERRVPQRTPLWLWTIWPLLWLLSMIAWALMPATNRMAKYPSLREWFEANARAGDELWQYDSGPDSWEHLAGECGYAIVRIGKVVDVWIEAVN